MAADEFNADKTNAHIHVHAESFQMRLENWHEVNKWHERSATQLEADV